jgi:hypothetical protein
LTFFLRCNPRGLLYRRGGQVLQWRISIDARRTVILQRKAWTCCPLDEKFKAKASILEA